jgi:hypothetical protein
MPKTFGPVYCETPDIATTFPIEPANTWSSGVIVLYGIAALVLVARRAPRDISFYALCVLLIVNGIGSILWHGMRTRSMLILDALPALIFVLIIAVLWARRVAPLWQAIAVGVVLIVLPLAFLRLGFGLLPAFRIITTAALIAAIGVWLVVRTFSVNRTTALIGAGALISAVAALTFRIVDSSACSLIPFGTHFLWHIFLSTAAFLCMLTLVRLKELRPR